MRLHRRSFLQSILAAGFSPALGSLTVRASDATPSASAYSIPPPDEDGYELWLRYRPVADPQALAHYRAMLSTLVSLAKEPFASSIADELDRACIGMIGARLTRATKISGDGTLLIGKTTESDAIGNAVDAKRLASLGAEAFALKSTVIDGHRTTIVAATSDRGLLYGVFALIKQLQLRLPVDALDIVDGPRAHLRLANHWDDLDRNVARGYAGLSIFDFSDLTQKNPRYLDYARLLASVGINGAVINDVNASPYVLDSGMMSGYSSLADILRGWGIRLYLSVNFASPMTLTVKDAHPISTADPLDHRVQHWWSQKIDEIYKHVPDFGGFVVKANSEGEPGPLAYKRTHAQGANMLAKPLAKHGGMLIWRTFVHRGFDNWSEFEYSTFHGLDGQFAANVILQTKNGPIDFQVIEPANPLFGAMPKTNQMIELEVTQEYTGHTTDVCYLPVYWSKVLGFDTHLSGVGPTVAAVVDGTADAQTSTGFAGVMNFGDLRNWTGSYLSAANTHGFARLAWDHTLSVDTIAAEWAALTFGPEERIVSVIAPLLLSSWNAVRRYTAPFGTGYLVRPIGAHFLPDPRSTQHLTHMTDSHGSGYDRTQATGTGFTRFYSDYWFDQYEHLDSCPEELAMFMHIVPWDHTLTNGSATIQQMYDELFGGADDVRAMQEEWQRLDGLIDHHRFTEVARQLDRHRFYSQMWRDVLASYYFDMTHSVSTNHPWVELETAQRPLLMLGGVANDVALELVNATGKPQALAVTIDPIQSGWTSTKAQAKLHSVDRQRISLTVTPPLEPALGAMRFVCEPASLTTIGFQTQTMIATPDARHCSFALDVGVQSESSVPGYTPFRAANVWDGKESSGWVDHPPVDVWLGTGWGALQRSFATSSSPHKLRIKLPAGVQRTWVLSGGELSGTPPMRVRMGKETLVETTFLPEGEFEWFGFALDGGKTGREVDLTFEGTDNDVWRLAALVVLKPKR